MKKLVELILFAIMASLPITCCADDTTFTEYMEPASMASSVSEERNVADILESHDVYTFHPNYEQYALTVLKPILPSHVTAILSDGSRTTIPVTGTWGINTASKCFENTASAAPLPAGTTDSRNVLDKIQIPYNPDPGALRALYYTGTKTEGQDTSFQIAAAGNEDVFQLYKADGTNPVLKFDSRNYPGFTIAGGYGIFTQLNTSVSDSGTYFALSFNSKGRTGSDNVPIYLSVSVSGPLQIEHCWGGMVRDDEGQMVLVCKICGIRYDQVYNPATGEKFQTEKTLEQVKAEQAAKALPSQTIKTESSTASGKKSVSRNSASKKKASSKVAKVKWKSIKKKGKSTVLKWKKVSGASYYEVYYRVGKSGKYKKLKKTTKLSYTHKRVKKGKTYYYKVRAVKKSGKKKITGSFSSVKKKKI